MTPDDSAITITQVFDAPRELVWTAFTTPEHVKRWYGGHGFENPVCEMDVRPGGRWRHLMRTPDGGEHPLAFVFVEVVPPERLVWRTATAVAGEPASVNTLTLEDLGPRTRITFVARFGSPEERDLARSFGFSTILAEGVDKMRAVLATLGKD